MILVPRVLIAEDDPSWAEILRQSMASPDWLLDSARSVERAIRRLDEEEYFALLLDIDFRGKAAGFQVLDRWLESAPCRRAIVVSGVLGDGAHHQAIAERGIKNVFRKTIDREAYSEIKRLLKTLLDEYLDEKRVEEERGIVRSVLSRLCDSHQQLVHRRPESNTFSLGNEYDVQDFLSALLTPLFDCVFREEPTKRAGTKASRIDIYIEALNTAIEAKFVRRRSDVARIDRELKEDIENWGITASCDHLFCLIADPTRRLHKQDRDGLRSLGGRRDFGGVGLTVEVVFAEGAT